MGNVPAVVPYVTVCWLCVKGDIKPGLPQRLCPEHVSAAKCRHGSLTCTTCWDRYVRYWSYNKTGIVPAPLGIDTRRRWLWTDAVRTHYRAHLVRHGLLITAENSGKRMRARITEAARDYLMARNRCSKRAKTSLPPLPECMRGVEVTSSGTRVVQ